ncbi:MAG: ion channel [Pseudomonadota bacterium]
MTAIWSNATDRAEGKTVIIQFLIGSAVICLSIAVTALTLGMSIRFKNGIHHPLVEKRDGLRNSLGLAVASLAGLATLAISVWIWAVLFLVIGVFHSLEPAVYFAIVSFTTLGFGDIILPVEWRLLSGLCAANGLIVFALIAAYLVEFLSRMHRAQIGDDHAFD